MPEFRLHLNGASHVCEEAGDPDGTRSVVFLHGFGVSHEMWRSQLGVVSDGWRAVSYDLRGHGRSDVGDGQYTMESYVDDLIRLLDRLRIDRAVLCGLSMGGYIALRAAERERERVSGLVLANTRSDGDDDVAKLRRADSIERIKANGVAAFSDRFLDGLFSQATAVHRPDAVEGVREMMYANSEAGLCGALLAMAGRTDTSGFLSDLEIPTLVIAGEEDTYMPLGAAHDLHAGIRGSRLEVLADAGHFSNLEAPVGFNTALAQFLGSDPVGGFGARGAPWQLQAR